MAEPPPRESSLAPGNSSLAPGKSRSGRNLPVAIASGLALAVVFLGTLAWHPYAFLTFIVVLVGAAVLELDHALRLTGARPATPVVIAAGAVLLVAAYLGGPAGQTAGLVLLLLGSAAWVLVGRNRGRLAASLGASCLMGLWVPFLASFVGLLLARPEGRWLVIATVALTVTSDTAAYAVGSRYGRHQLAPSVSPAKSWEGFAGGLLAVLVVAVVIVPRLPGLDLPAALLLGVGVFLAATLGDLTESMVKRDLGIKDLGVSLPGHGGVMERADAVIFALPAAHLLLTAVGR